MEAAAEQGLTGCLYAALSQDEEPRWTESARSTLRDRYHALLLRGTRLLDLASRTQQRLLGQGLRTLPLKGAAIAETLYTSVAERPMSDIDLLALDDWAETLHALEAIGFQETDRGDHAIGLADSRSGFIVELHHTVTSCPGFFPLDREGLWKRSRTTAGHRLPSGEDLLVQLALHAAFQHGLGVSLVQYLDIRRLMEHEGLDLDGVLEIARQARAEKALAWALLAAASVLGLTVPPKIERALHLGAMPSWLEPYFSHPLSFLQSPPSLARVRWELASGRRLEWVGRTLAPPRGAGVSPPRKLVFIVSRACRLFGRFVLSRGGRLRSRTG